MDLGSEKLSTRLSFANTKREAGSSYRVDGPPATAAKASRPTKVGEEQYHPFRWPRTGNVQETPEICTVVSQLGEICYGISVSRVS